MCSPLQPAKESFKAMNEGSAKIVRACSKTAQLCIMHIMIAVFFFEMSAT